MENTQRICTFLHSFKEYLVVYIINDEGFYVVEVSIFMARVALINEEERKKHSMSIDFRIKHIQASWKGHIDI
jgi:hypothetical protein